MNKVEKIKEKLMDKRLVIVSNREPYSHHYLKSKIKVKENPGGLTSALDPVMKKLNDSLWIAWGSSDADFEVLSEAGEGNEKIRIPDEKGYLLKRVKLTPHEVKHYYEGFSNNILWPNSHLFSDKCMFSEEDWQVYKDVNKKFASKILDEKSDKEELIWIHDYHFFLVPMYVKRKKPDAKIAFFYHIPFPPYEIFSHLCTHWVEELLNGLLYSDMIGFQTKDYVDNFIRTAEKISGAKREGEGVRFKGRLIKVKNFPISIDYEKFDIPFPEEKIEKQTKKLHLDNKIILFGVDRLDYTKGLLERLWAFGEFLEKNENLREKVVFVQITTPTRTNVEEYKQLKRKIDRVIGEINSKFRDSSTGLEPIRCYYKPFKQNELIFYYKISDVVLVTPLADGMNLVAKEFVASSNKGVLILSNCVGASKQLKEALVVNPRDIPEISSAIESAVSMPEKEKINRINKLKERVKNEDLWHWLENFFDEWTKIYK